MVTAHIFIAYSAFFCVRSAFLLFSVLIVPTMVFTVLLGDFIFMYTDWIVTDVADIILQCLPLTAANNGVSSDSFHWVYLKNAAPGCV